MGQTGGETLHAVGTREVGNASWRSVCCFWEGTRVIQVWLAIDLQDPPVVMSHANTVFCVCAPSLWNIRQVANLMRISNPNMTSETGRELPPMREMGGYRQTMSGETTTLSLIRFREPKQATLRRFHHNSQERLRSKRVSAADAGVLTTKRRVNRFGEDQPREWLKQHWQRPPLWLGVHPPPMLPEQML